MSEHQMEHTDHGKYADEFRCHVCGRTVIWVWTECPTMIVVHPGDTEATHTGATGGLQIGGVGVEAEQFPPSIEQFDPRNEQPAYDKRLRPWERFMQDIGGE